MFAGMLEIQVFNTFNCTQQQPDHGQVTLQSATIYAMGSVSSVQCSFLSAGTAQGDIDSLFFQAAQTYINPYPNLPLTSTFDILLNVQSNILLMNGQAKIGGQGGSDPKTSHASAYFSNIAVNGLPGTQYTFGSTVSFDSTVVFAPNVKFVSSAGPPLVCMLF